MSRNQQLARAISLYALLIFLTLVFLPDDRGVRAQCFDNRFHSLAHNSIDKETLKQDTIYGYYVGGSECEPRTIIQNSDQTRNDPSENGAVEIEYNDNKLTFYLINYRYSCSGVCLNPVITKAGNTLNVFVNATEGEDNWWDDGDCTCESMHEILFKDITPGHYVINMVAADSETIYATCDTTLATGFKHIIYDNRKPLPDNHREGKNYVVSDCLDDSGYEPGGHNDENLPPDEELGSVRLSYNNGTLRVELRGWLFYCGLGSPLAIIDEGLIRINIDFSLMMTCICYQNLSFEFDEIEAGQYQVKLLCQEFYDTFFRIFDVDLQDGYSHLFLKNTSDLTSVNNFDDSYIEFDGTLVEFSSDGNATLELFTTEGVRLARAEGSGTVRLSTGELMPGIYVVRATTADGRTARRKIVVK